MKIRLTRLSNDRHRLAIERADGSREERELETRSVLLHDLVHYAVETEAGIADGFWGALASGIDYDELLEQAKATLPGLPLAEALVGPLQAVWKERLDPDRYVDQVNDLAPFVDRAFVERTCERIRRLWGHWQGTPFHATMELTWPTPGNRV